MDLDKKYWQERFQNQNTPWDTGSVTAPIKEYIDQLKNKNIRILLPGCGNAHEGKYLVDKGFLNVTILDIVPEAIDNAKASIGERCTFVCEDFFGHEGVYDLILEQTFFCALEPSRRSEYITHMHRLLKKNGKLVGLLFGKYFEKAGPPFGGEASTYRKLFSTLFEIKIMEPCYNSIAPRADSELWVHFIKKA